MPLSLGVAGYLLGLSLFPPEREYAEWEEMKESANVQERLAYLKGLVGHPGLDQTLRELLSQITATLEALLPQSEGMKYTETRYTVRRLIIHDLPGLLDPYLRLSPASREGARPQLLGASRDLEREVKDLLATIEAKDMIELERKAVFIARKYRHDLLKGGSSR